MQKRLTLALLGALAAPFPATAQIINHFGTGIIRSGFTTGQTTITSQEQSTVTKQVFTGSSYTVTGENITPAGTLAPGQTYSIARPGEPFQFSTTYQEPGLQSIETTGRTINTQTLTNSLSVFSEIQ